MSAPPAGAHRATLFWLALWTGVSVACIYLAQPLLYALAGDLSVPEAEMGLVTTVTQAGYGVGIFLLVPLGDALPRPALVRTKLALLTLATFMCSLSPGFGTLLATSFAIGVLATTGQDLVPIAADLAPDDRRGRYVGAVMTGLMLGIVLSRSLAGFVEEAFGWRRVFQLGAVAVGACFVASLLTFPQVPRRARAGSVTSLYTSMISLLGEHPRLRLAIVRHGLLGLAFSAFWTNLSFFLSEAPYGWDSARIGLMGLAGLSGAVATFVIGRVSDRHGPLYSIRVATVLASAAFLAMGLWQRSAVLLVGATMAFDFAVQSSLVAHQSIIYGLDPSARGRINALFVSTMFVCFSLGSAVSLQIWARAGWTGVMAFCAGSGLCAFLLTLRRRARASA